MFMQISAIAMREYGSLDHPIYFLLSLRIRWIMDICVSFNAELVTVNVSKAPSGAWSDLFQKVKVAKKVGGWHKIHENINDLHEH